AAASTWAEQVAGAKRVLEIGQSGFFVNFGAQEEAALMADTLRDLFGNPFRPLPALAPEILSWNDQVIVKMSQAIYDERAFDRLPILADALEDAGCTDADILNHCRWPFEHVRGCWLVDLIL